MYLLELVALDPLIYYMLVDFTLRVVVCDTRTFSLMSDLLGLDNLLVGSGAKQLLPSWEHYKAYISAFASWTKAYMLLLGCGAAAASPAVKSAPAEVASAVSALPAAAAASSSAGNLAAEVADDQASYAMEDLERMLAFFGLQVLQVQIKDPSEAATVAAMTVVEGEPTPGTTQLIVLLYLARAVAATAKQMTGMVAAASRSSSSSSGGCTTVARGITNIDVPAMIRAYEDLAFWNQGHHSALARAVVLGLMLSQNLIQWHLVATGQAAPRLSADSEQIAGTATAASSSIATSSIAAAGLQALTTPPYQPLTTPLLPPPAAPGVCTLPKRLTKLPHQGLPAAVVAELESILSKRSTEGHLSFKPPEEEEQQRQLLGELLLLFDVLLAEVPCPVGCNNPACCDMSGESELAASSKVCLGCKVAYYCSQKCQKGHWKVHKPTCRRLQKEREVEEQQQAVGAQ